jgi:hypothetical protein
MRRGTILVLLGAAACVGSLARGSTITYVDDTVDDALLVLSSGGTVTSTSYGFGAELPEFDPALGALTEVRLSMSAETIAAFVISSGGGGMARLGAGVAPNDGTLTILGAGLASITFPYGNATGEVFGASSVPATLFEPLSITDTETFTTPDVFPYFTGPGTFAWKWEPTATVTPAGPGNTAALRLVSYSASVTYTYTAVPEPSTAAIAAVGLLSLCGVSLHRHRFRQRG